MNIYRFCNFLLILVISLCTSYDNDQLANRYNTQSSNLKIILPDFGRTLESDTHLTIDKNSRVYFSENIGGKYQIMSYSGDTRIVNRTSQQASTNLLRPFFFNDSVRNLSEHQGSGKYKITDPTLSDIAGSQTIERLYVSNSGNQLVLKFDGDVSLYYIDKYLLCRKAIFAVVDQLIDVCFLDNGRIVISVGLHLFLYNKETNDVSEIFTWVGGKKMNISSNGSSIYFCSNFASNFYCIYEHNLSSQKTDLRLSSFYDLRLPKRFGNDLYYLTVVKSKYLLRRLDCKQNVSFGLTEKGVVYDYIVDGRNVYYTYSDLNTSRCLKRYDTVEQKSYDINCTNLDLDITVSYDEHLTICPTYTLAPSNKKAIKGVILYFHPGVSGGDFSPRWDNLLIPFCINGYIVIAPNYPGSTGYGKEHSGKSFQEAVVDMKKWISEIRNQYSELPLFCYGVSSGSILMEATLKGNKSAISGAISAFGLPFDDYHTKIPFLYILGKRDPVLPFVPRFNQLVDTKITGRSLNIVSLHDEGHWIQTTQGFKVFYREALQFLKAKTHH